MPFYAMLRCRSAYTPRRYAAYVTLFSACYATIDYAIYAILRFAAAYADAADATPLRAAAAYYFDGCRCCY